MTGKNLEFDFRTREDAAATARLGTELQGIGCEVVSITYTSESASEKSYWFVFFRYDKTNTMVRDALRYLW